ncbi:hypothetical protein CGLO_14319 [Colletotrichum gloeosporioides Cg-14]|uniref:Uncharacterized protein n=1 Tax=Colletotrichum gloeosporioides (strain Cg-14) TaxID=1237896 RepID=T0L4Y5_COLGC|nr:hypothetical protein CGLO_14319 [Colletotrichum gloeosporioides Cg-14]
MNKEQADRSNRRDQKALTASVYPAD